MDFAVIGLFVELSVDCGLGKVENDDFFLLFWIFLSKRSQFLVDSVNEVVESWPYLIFLCLILIVEWIKRGSEGVVVQEKKLGVVVDFFKQEFFDFLEGLVVDCNYMVAVDLADIDQFFLNDLFCVFDHHECLLAADHIIEALDFIFEHMVQSILDLEQPYCLILAEHIQIVREVQFVFFQPLIIQILVILEFGQRF